MFIRYGKKTQKAVAAMSLLAQRYDEEGSLVSSLEIARARNLSKPLTAKLLTILSTGGLVEGATGPQGGYRLAKPPGDINLLEVVALFERDEPLDLCPFGPGWCGNRAPCPLHDELVQLYEQGQAFLRDTTFEVFSI